MSKEIPDIAMWEETDSELAKYNIQSLSSLIKNQEEQLKANDLMINELINRINKAIEYITNGSDFKSIYFKKTDEELWKVLLEDNIKNNLFDILRGESNE